MCLRSYLRRAFAPVLSAGKRHLEAALRVVLPSVSAKVEPALARVAQSIPVAPALAPFRFMLTSSLRCARLARFPPDRRPFLPGHPCATPPPPPRMRSGTKSWRRACASQERRSQRMARSPRRLLRPQARANTPVSSLALHKTGGPPVLHLSFHLRGRAVDDTNFLVSQAGKRSLLS